MAYKTIDEIIELSIEEGNSNNSKADLYYNEFISELEDHINQIDVELVRIMTMNEKRAAIKKLCKKILRARMYI